jgi:hypothetical protein
MKQNSSLEAGSRLADQEIERLLRNSKVNCSNKIKNWFHCMGNKLASTRYEDGMA